jgi:alkylhydroperoxidase family enzyme
MSTVHRSASSTAATARLTSSSLTLSTSSTGGGSRDVPDAAYEEVAAEYTPAEVAALLSLILAINAWNILGVTTRAWEPGSYQR